MVDVRKRVGVPLAFLFGMVSGCSSLHVDRDVSHGVDQDDRFVTLSGKKVPRYKGSEGVVDNIIWEGDILSVSLYRTKKDDQLLTFIVEGMDEGDRTLVTYDGLPAVVSLTKVIENSEEARLELASQIQKNIVLRGGNQIAANAIRDVVDSLYLEFVKVNDGKLKPEIVVSKAQQDLFFANYNKVPVALQRAVDMDDVKLVVDDSHDLSGSVPKEHAGVAGTFVDGNVFVSYPYEPETIAEEIVHYVDRAHSFSSRKQFVEASDRFIQDADFMHFIGYILNKNYRPNGDAYDLNYGASVALELLADLYVIGQGMTQGMMMDSWWLSCLGLEDNKEPMTRLEGSQRFYDKVVRGKTVAEVEQYYEGRMRPIHEDGGFQDILARNLALSLALIPEEKLDRIWQNMDDPATLLKAMYPKDMVSEYKGFEGFVGSVYSDAKLSKVKVPEL